MHTTIQGERHTDEDTKQARLKLREFLVNFCPQTDSHRTPYKLSLSFVSSHGAVIPLGHARERMALA